MTVKPSAQNPNALIFDTSEPLKAEHLKSEHVKTEHLNNDQLLIGDAIYHLADHTPMMVQYLILTASFFVIETSWQLIYTVSGKTLAAWLQQGSRLMWLNRLCGAIFVLIAAGLIYDML